MRFPLYVVPIATILMLVGCGSDSDSDSASDCLTGSTQCEDTCVNLQEDQLNCGACGTVCDAGEVCSAGVCALSCQTGLTDCSGSCRDLQTDQANCGACDNNCVAGQACVSGTCETWEALTGYDEYGLVDFVPAGEDLLLADSSGTAIYSYSVADDTWSTAYDTLVLPGGYSYPAWDGDKLFWLYGTSVHSYVIATGVVTSTAVALMPSCSDSQTTADEAHNLYALAQDGTIVQYNTETETLATFTGPTDLPGDGQEPRLAWDSKTAKVYIADYYDTPFYSFDPSDGTLTALAAFPDDTNNGLNDAFCSDRQGFIYTTDSAGANHLLWIFDTAAGVWKSSNLPFEVGSSGNCTVSGDGYLYLLGEGIMYRLRVFNS